MNGEYPGSTPDYTNRKKTENEQPKSGSKEETALLIKSLADMTPEEAQIVDKQWRENKITPEGKSDFEMKRLAKLVRLYFGTFEATEEQRQRWDKAA